MSAFFTREASLNEGRIIACFSPFVYSSMQRSLMKDSCDQRYEPCTMEPIHPEAHIMAAIPRQHMRRIGLLLCMIVCGLLIAHSINAFVAEALYVIPTYPVGSRDDRSMGSS